MARSRSNRASYRCSFCGKTQDQVRRLISGSAGVYICNECVNLCRDIIDEEQTRAPKSARAMAGRDPHAGTPL